MRMMRQSDFDRTARRGLLLLGAACVVAIGGACQQPQRPSDLTLGDLGAEQTPDEIWDRTLSVLREHGFEPDVQDRATGRITTRPETSKQWHEPWRKDVADKYDLMASSLHTMQRQVTVQFVRDGNRWQASVTVMIYQLSRVEPQITTASSVLPGYSGSLPNVTGERGGAAPRWREVGRDHAMEMRLLNEIV